MTEPHTLIRARKSGYMPSLDGWRAVAILGVLMAHDRSWTLFGHSLDFLMGYGGYGVNLFFAISGFLITTRILEEEAIVGSFHIGRFYTRRLFRIQPAQFVFLACAAALAATGILHREYLDTARTWLSSLLLYINFLWRPSSPNVVTGHFWTLAVEEHFYILLSLTLLFVKKRRALVLFLFFLACDIPMELLGNLKGDHWYLPLYAPRATQWHLAPLLLAALTAILVRRPALSLAVRRYLKPWVAFFATLLLSLTLHAITLSRIHQPLVVYRHLDAELPFISTYLFITWILATVFHPQSLTTRLLEWKPARFIGTISYSLYLWHIVVFYFWSLLFLYDDSRFVAIAHTRAFHFVQLPLKYAFSLLVASASYYFVEKPFIRIGHRLAPAATPGRLELRDLPLEQINPPSNSPSHILSKDERQA